VKTLLQQTYSLRRPLWPIRPQFLHPTSVFVSVMA
jgi:hypothetical protein